MQANWKPNFLVYLRSTCLKTYTIMCLLLTTWHKSIGLCYFLDNKDVREHWCLYWKSTFGFWNQSIIRMLFRFLVFLFSILTHFCHFLFLFFLFSAFVSSYLSRCSCTSPLRRPCPLPKWWWKPLALDSIAGIWVDRFNPVLSKHRIPECIDRTIPNLVAPPAGRGCVAHGQAARRSTARQNGMS